MTVEPARNPVQDPGTPWIGSLVDSDEPVFRVDTQVDEAIHEWWVDLHEGQE